MSRPQAVRTLARQPPPPGIYASKYDPYVAAAICVRLAAGESLRSICRADPAMPTERTVWKWARAHPEFARLKAGAMAAARRRSLALRDELAAARRITPGGVKRRRAWNEGVDGYLLDHMVAWRVLARLEAGEALTDVCREDWAPCRGTFYNWLKRYPSLLAEYRLCKAIACEAMVEEAREDSPWLGEEAASVREMQRRERAAMRRAAKLATKRYAGG